MRFLSAAALAGLMLAAIPMSASAVTLPAPPPAVGEGQPLVEKAYGSRFYFSYGVPRYRSYYYRPYSYYYRPYYAYSYVPRVYYPSLRYYYPRHSYGIRFRW